MDVFSALRKRRMHRYFAPLHLGDETLRAVAWAATRAPVAGNEPSRFLLVVRDPRLVQTVIDVSPSYIGTTPAAMFVILTDVDRAEVQMGTHGREQLSRIDAGAAAENVALAAVALGLGCYLFRSSNDAALRVVFRLPPHVRVEWIAAVGRIAANPSIAAKMPRQVVYIDQWAGEQWEVRSP